MSGANVRGAKPKADIKTRQAKRDPVTNMVTKKSDVEVRMKVTLGLDIKIGALVQPAQANGIQLAITKPPMALTKEATALPPLPNTICNELTLAFPTAVNEQWVAWFGTLPGNGDVPALDLKTVLQIDGSAIPAWGFQTVPVLMTMKGIPFKGGHYLIDTSIIPGQDVAATAAAPKTKKTKKTKSAKKPEPKKKR